MDEKNEDGAAREISTKQLKTLKKSLDFKIKPNHFAEMHLMIVVNEARAKCRFASKHAHHWSPLQWYKPQTVVLPLRPQCVYDACRESGPAVAAAITNR